MNPFRTITTFMFVISFTDLARLVVAQCRCGITALSQTLFSEIVDDGTCNATSACVINDTAIDPETYKAVKALNCTSECFDSFGTAPVPSATAIPITTTSQASVLPHSALIAIIVGAIVFLLFVVCLIGVWLRKRKRTKKKSNRVIVSHINASIRDDLHAIITSGSRSVSSKSSEDDIKISPALVVSTSHMTTIPSNETPDEPPQNLRDMDDSIRIENVQYESDESPSTPSQPQPSQARPAEEISDPPNPEELVSHPVDLDGSPDWDDIEIQLENGSSRWTTTTSLDHYLHSQGFGNA